MKTGGAGNGCTEFKNAPGTIGEQLLAYMRSIKEERLRGETEEQYGARICAKARTGQKLTAAEMSYLARTNPELYQKVLRAQTLRKWLESRLHSCRSKQEAQQAFSDAVSSISEKDADRDMIIAALNAAFREFRESGEYQSLPEKTEEEEGANKEKEQLQYTVNEEGYQETWHKAEDLKSFSVMG